MAPGTGSLDATKLPTPKRHLGEVRGAPVHEKSFKDHANRAQLRQRDLEMDASDLRREGLA